MSLYIDSRIELLDAGYWMLDTKLLSLSIAAAVQIRQSKGLFATTNRFTFMKMKVDHEKYCNTCP